MKGEALKGHLDMLLLAALEARPAHGYAVIEELKRLSGGALDLPEGTVYPALHRLEPPRLLAYGWAKDTPRPPREGVRPGPPTRGDPVHAGEQAQAPGRLGFQVLFVWKGPRRGAAPDRRSEFRLHLRSGGGALQRDHRQGVGGGAARPRLT